MKKLLIFKLNVFWLTVILCLSFNSFILAKSYLPDIVLNMQINNSIMEINGKEADIDHGQNTTPIISNGRTLVPIRAIIEAFNGQVFWDELTQTVTLKMENNTLKLQIDRTKAFLNDREYTLDVAPQIINGRTMLPIRFIAESFNLGVAWNDTEQQVYIVRNSFSTEESDALRKTLPAYFGQAYVTINNNIPFFEDYEIINAPFEYYNTPDALGRCNVSMASISEDIMPTTERESLSSVTPTGWNNKKYDIVEGGYIYNRCHLIGYQLSGENENAQNLITGTRYLNINGMLPFENMVDDYVEETDNRVMYRVTPIFGENNLVADGVLIEAYSIEDCGAGISFCVYCYNVQPGIFINYETGENNLVEDLTSSDADILNKIYRTPTGKRYHTDANCGGSNSYEITLDDAVNAGLTPCQKCAY